MASLDIIEEHLGIDFANVRLRNGRKRHDKNQYYYFPHQYYIVNIGELNKWCIMTSNDKTRRLLDEHIWHATPPGYTRTTIEVDRKSKGIFLHRMIMDCPEDKVIDHINRCKYDNRVDNLRICTIAENNRNMPIRKNNTIGISGVSRVITTNGGYRWVAGIRDWDGNYLREGFSCTLLGEEEAKRRIIEWRKQKEQELGYIGE
jgi:hypothetical protein